MAIVRRGARRKKKLIVVTFQRGLLIGGAILNLIASGGAGISAYYSWKQTTVAIDAVNIQSRNQAFSEYLAAYSDVCDVSLTKYDKDIFLTDVLGPWLYKKSFDFEFEIRRLRLNQLSDMPAYDLDAYLAQVERKQQVRWEKLQQLSIWLDGPRDEINQVNPPHNGKWAFDEDKRPPPYLALEQQRICNNQLDFLIALYKNPDDPKVHLLRDKRFWVIPISEDKSTDKILEEWDRKDMTDSMTDAGVWPAPNDDGNQP